jgi:hypothetical protein
LTIAACSLAVGQSQVAGTVSGHGKINIGDRIVAVDGMPLIDSSGSAVNGGTFLKDAFQVRVTEGVTCRTEGHARYHQHRVRPPS